MLAEEKLDGTTMLRILLPLSRRTRQIQPLTFGMLRPDEREAERHLHHLQQVNCVNINVTRLLNGLIYR